MPPTAANPLHATFCADRAAQIRTPIIENVQLARDTFRVRFDAPQIAAGITPGQFIMIRVAGCDDPLLARPLALYDTVLSPSGQPQGLDVVYLVAGKFTRRLATCRPGQMLDVWGPLGNGFPPQAAEHLIMVAGGIGQTPMLALAAEHLGKKTYGNPPRQTPRSQRITFCYGARSQEYLAGIDDFKKLNIEIRLSTDNGTAGHHGFVTDLLRQVLNEELSNDAAPHNQTTTGHGSSTQASSLQPPASSLRIVCCGPEPMMEAVAEIAHQFQVPCQVSLETPMACGIGICFTCVAKIRQPDGTWDYKRTCVEGPIFDADQIEWK